MNDTIGVETTLAPAASHANAPTHGGEIRLSFGFFYVVLKWGPEKRATDRLKDERRRFPVITATHAPVLVATYAVLILLCYFALTKGLEGLIYLFS